MTRNTTGTSEHIHRTQQVCPEHMTQNMAEHGRTRQARPTGRVQSWHWHSILAHQLALLSFLLFTEHMLMSQLSAIPTVDSFAWDGISYRALSGKCLTEVVEANKGPTESDASQKKEKEERRWECFRPLPLIDICRDLSHVHRDEFQASACIRIASRRRVPALIHHVTPHTWPQRWDFWVIRTWMSPRDFTGKVLVLNDKRYSVQRNTIAWWPRFNVDLIPTQVPYSKLQNGTWR